MATTSWNIDASHSLAEFSVKHMMVSTTKGQFGDVSGVIAFDPNDLTASSVEATIGVASITTRDEKRDGHLRSADFFDVENHPSITFQSTKIVKTDDDEYDVHGDLTIRGVTRQVVLEMEFNGVGKNPWGIQVAGFSAKTKIDRQDFGLTWSVALETGGVLVSNDVKVHLEIEANPAQ